MAKGDMVEVTEASNNFLKWNTTREMNDDFHDHTENTVLSGHFMVSSLTDGDVGEDDVEDNSTTSSKKEDKPGYDFTLAIHDTAQTYKFGSRSTNHLSIDASLTKLFECMTLAYSGKLTSPKWKNFKGIKVPLKDKIRLNNIIWREWHMQYIQGKFPIVCQFEPPISEKMHNKPEAVVLEGKYWKRRLESVTAEYKKWRMFFRDRCKKESRDDSSIEVVQQSDGIENRFGSVSRITTPTFLNQQFDHFMTDEDFIMDLSDTLFSSLNQPFTFPNPREISQLGNADIIQPGLVQLQPSLDDYMDTLEPLPPLLNEMIGSFGRSGSVTSTLQSMFSSLPHTRSTPVPMETNLNANDSTAFSSLLGSTSRQESPPAQQSSFISNSLSTQISSSKPVFTNQSLPVHNSPSITTNLDPITLSALLNANSVQSSDVDKKVFSNGSSQVINLVLNPNLSATNDNQSRSNISKQPETGLSGKQQPFQIPSQPTVQQLLTQQNQQQQQAKTVTIIQNASLQALLQGLSQPQNPGQTAAAQIFNSPAQILNSQSIPQVITTQTLPQVLNQPAAPKYKTDTNETSDQIKGVHLKKEPRMDSDLSNSDLRSTIGFVNTTNNGVNVISTNTTDDILSKLEAQGSVPGSSTELVNVGGVIQFRKDGDFLVPSTTRVPKTKPRNIAPALPPVVSGSPMTATSNSLQPSTVLAQLLTQTASLPAIKRENPSPTPVSAFTPIKPAPLSVKPTTSDAMPSNPCINFSMATASPVNDFQKNLLIAAVSQAFGNVNNHVNDVSSSTAQIFMHNSNPTSPQHDCSSPQFPIPSSPGSDIDSRSRHTSNESTGSTQGIKEEGSIKPFRPKNEVERAQYKELRRASHISAEKKRRGNIKVGFEMLHQLVPSLRMTSSSKSSIANTLGKAADYCQKLKQERTQMQDEAEVLKQEIESLNNSISVCQSQLPATGVPVTRQRADQMREMFDNYVRCRTLQNWKFWIFSIIIRSLLDSYNKTVSTASVDELCRTVLAWLEQHCSLVALRPTVLNSLRQLCTSTSILSDPSKVPEQAQQAVQNPGDLSEALGSSPS